MMTSGASFGVDVEAAIGAILLAYGIFWERLTRLKLVTGVLTVAVALTVAATLVIVIYGSIPTAAYDEDEAIVLGTALDDGQIGRELKARLDVAADYASRNLTAYIMVTGNQTPAEDSYAASVAMSDYLLSKNIPKIDTPKEGTNGAVYFDSRILSGYDCTDTLESMKRLKVDDTGMWCPWMSPEYYDNWMRDWSIDSHSEMPDDLPHGRFTIITSNCNVLRAEIIAHELGLSVTHIGSATEFYLLIPSALEEIPAIVMDWVLAHDAGEFIN